MGTLSRLWHFLADGPRQLSGPEYHHFYRIVIPTARGTSEIDHLIVSPFGVFVIELKDYSGWIFGNSADAQWTAVYFRQRHRFQNPVHQNFGHLKALEEFLSLERRFLHGIVVFRGNFSFKTEIPEGVLCHRYKTWVASHQQRLLDHASVVSAAEKLRTQAERGWAAGRRHAQSVRERYESDTTCPKCGGELRIRVQRQGPDPGSRFLGCSNYPRCKFTKGLP